MENPIRGTEIQQYSEIEIADSVTSISDFNFVNCENLLHITIPQSVTSIGNGAFYGCTNLIRAIIPNSVTSFGEGVFENCKTLNSVKIPEYDMIPKHTFENCYLLKTVNIPENLVTIDDHAFLNCKSLSYFDLPETVETIGEQAFTGCDKFTRISIRNNVSEIGANAFSSCINVSGAEIISSVLTYIPVGMCQHDNKLKIVRIASPITTIGQGAFQDCESLQEITLPSSLAGGVIEEMAFANCTSLKKIIFTGTRDEWNSIIFKGEGNMAWNYNVPDDIIVICKGDVTVWEWEHSNNVEEYIFGSLYRKPEYKDVTSVHLGASITTIKARAFYKFENLTDVYVSKYLTDIEWFAFYGCDKLRCIHFDGTYNEWMNNVHLYRSQSTINPNLTYPDWKEGAAKLRDNGFTIKFTDTETNIPMNEYYVVCVDENSNIFWTYASTKEYAPYIEPPKAGDKFNSGRYVFPDNYIYSNMDKYPTAVVFTYTTKKQDKIVETDGEEIISPIRYIVDCSVIPGWTAEQIKLGNKLLNNYILEQDEYNWEYVFRLKEDNTTGKPTYVLEGQLFKKLNITSTIDYSKSTEKTIKSDFGEITYTQYSSPGVRIFELNTLGNGDDFRIRDCISVIDFTWNISKDAKKITTTPKTFNVSELIFRDRNIYHKK